MQGLLQNVELTGEQREVLQAHLITAWNDYNTLGLRERKLQWWIDAFNSENKRVKTELHPNYLKEKWENIIAEVREQTQGERLSIGKFVSKLDVELKEGPEKEGNGFIENGNGGDDPFDLDDVGNTGLLS